MSDVFGLSSRDFSTIQWTGANIVRLFMPMSLGYAVSAMCWKNTGGRRRNAGSSVRFRPPSYVFGIVWPVLYVLLGLSWVVSSKKDSVENNELCFLSISILLASWIVVYGCKNRKIWGIYAITLSIGATILTMNLVKTTSRVLLVPLLTWLLLALLMNVIEVSK